MSEIGSSGNMDTKSSDNPEGESSATEKVYKELFKVANKLNDILFDGDGGNENGEDKGDSHEESQNVEKKDTAESNDARDNTENTENKNEDTAVRAIKTLMDRLFSEDLMNKDVENGEQSSDTDSEKGFDDADSQNEKKTEQDTESKNIEKNEDSNESNIEKKDPILEKIQQMLETPEGIKALIERYPEKAELWKSQLDALETLNDPDASPAEIRSAQAKLSVLKGQLLETAVKDALADAGFDVEAQQRVVEGESGGTRPDIIAKNNTDHPIEVFGATIQPGELLSVECKCGGSAYLNDQLVNHIPNQLSGQEGTKVLLTTSDIKNTTPGLAESVCSKYNANLAVIDVSVSAIENAIKEVSKS